LRGSVDTQGSTDGVEAPMVDLSVVIVSWNTRALTLGSIAAVGAASGALRVETIVVDNGSRDGSPGAIRERFPDVRVIETGRNLGFAGGNNAGLRAARGRFVCLLNSDTEARAGSLAALVAHLEAHPELGAVGPRLLNADGSEQAVGFRFPSLAQVALDLFPLGGRFAESRVNGRYPHEPRDRAFAIDFPLGACIVARREAVEATGPLDEGFHMYSEEVDWCRRMRAAGWGIECLPTAEVVHFGGQSTSQQPARMFYELHRSRACYFRRWHGAGFVWAARWITRAGMAKEALVAWRRYRRGELTREGMRERVRACGKVLRIEN